MAEKKRTIFERMIAVARDVDPIAKDRKNVQQNFKYRGVDDIYNALQAVLAKHGVFAVPYVVGERTEERKSKSGSALIYRVLTIDYWFYGEDGDWLPLPARVIGEGMDSGDKASNKAMAVADKYALLQAFKIPTDDAKDPDGESHEVEPKQGRRSDRAPQQSQRESRVRQPSSGQQPSGQQRDWNTNDRYRFGPHKGKPLTDGSDEGIQKYAEAIAKGIDQGKGYATQEHLDAVYAEIADRENANPDGPGRYDDAPPHGDDDIPF